MKKKNFVKKAGRFLKFFSLAVVILFAVPVVYLKYIVRDIRPIDDSDMKIEARRIPENENAYPLLLLSMLEVNDPLLDPLRLKLASIGKKAVKGVPVGNKELDEAALLFQEKISTIERASKMKYSKGPWPMKPEDRIPIYITMRDLALLRLALAKREFAAGKKDEAFEAALAMARFGRLVEQNDGGTLIISLMVGNSIKRNALVTINEFLDTGYLPGEPQNAIKGLADTYESDTAWINVWKHEYGFLKNDVYKSNIENRAVSFLFSLIFKPERTKKAVHDIAIARIKDSTRRSASKIERFDYREFSPPGYFTPEFFRLMSRGELGTNYYLAFTMPNFMRAVEKKFFIDFLTDATRLRLAVLSYRKDHGALPESLDALTPGYIDNIPYDRFDGKKLRYDSGRKIIYSAGMNFKDDKGDFKKSIVEELDWNKLREEKDIALKVAM